MEESPELRLLFHRLNNQLGIILAHGELLEAKAADNMNRARATQLVASTLEAMETAREIRRQVMSTADGR
jgi:transcriptional antiterminator Rof (Rho-off)